MSQAAVQRWRANILNALEGALDIYGTGRGQHPQLEQAMSPRYQRLYAIIQDRQARPLAQESVAYWWALMVQLRETRALMDEGLGEYVIIHNVPALRTLTRMRDMQVVYLHTYPGVPILRCVGSAAAAAEAAQLLWDHKVAKLNQMEPPRRRRGHLVRYRKDLSYCAWERSHNLDNPNPRVEGAISISRDALEESDDDLLSNFAKVIGTGRQAYEPPPLKLFPRVRTADLYGMVPALDAQENARHAPEKWWELSNVPWWKTIPRKKKES